MMEKPYEVSCYETAVPECFQDDNLFDLDRIYESRYWIMNQFFLDEINLHLYKESRYTYEYSTIFFSL